MIVKHVTESLRRQDWVAVAIEFLLVVVGVLLAFQIDEWASEREARAERQAAALRLLFEAEEDVAYFRQSVEQRQSLVSEFSYALDQIQKESGRTADRIRMQSGLTRGFYLVAPTPPSSVYDDIVAAGLLGEIGDPQLRSAIGKYRAELSHLSKLIDYVRQTVPSLEEQAALRYVYDATGPRPARLDVDFAALERDSGLQSSLVLLNDRQAFILRAWRSTLHAAEAMCRELGRHAERRCNLNRRPPEAQ